MCFKIEKVKVKIFGFKMALFSFSGIHCGHFWDSLFNVLSLVWSVWLVWCLILNDFNGGGKFETNISGTRLELVLVAPFGGQTSRPLYEDLLPEVLGSIHRSQHHLITWHILDHNYKNYKNIQFVCIDY